MAATTRNKGLVGATRLVRAGGGEVAVGPGEVLITPASVVGGGASGKAAKENLVKGSLGEVGGGIGWGKVLKRSRGVTWGIRGE